MKHSLGSTLQRISDHVVRARNTAVKQTKAMEEMETQDAKDANVVAALAECEVWLAGVIGPHTRREVV